MNSSGAGRPRMVNGDHDHTVVPFDAIKTTDSMHIFLILLFIIATENTKPILRPRHGQQTRRTHRIRKCVRAKKNKAAAPLAGNIITQIDYDQIIEK